MRDRFYLGRMYCTDDPGAIRDAMARGFEVISLVDVGESMNFPNCSILSNLLPPPESLQAYINGDELSGKRIYYDYLCSPGREETIVTILEVLYKKNIDLLIYVEHDPNIEFHILEVLWEFFSRRYGFVIGEYANPNRQFVIIPDRPDVVCIVADLLFVYGRISKEEYAMITPPNMIPSERACNLLLRSINYGFNTIQDCYNAGYRLLSEIRQGCITGKKPMVFCMIDEAKKEREKEINDKVMNSETRFG